MTRQRSHSADPVASLSRTGTWLWRTIFLGAFFFATIMAWLPHPPPLPGEPGDKFQHVLAFAALGLLGMRAFPRLRHGYLLAALAAHGALIELVQAIPALHRDSDLKDWIADVAAVAAAIAIVRAIGLIRRGKAGPARHDRS